MNSGRVGAAGAPKNPPKQPLRARTLVLSSRWSHVILRNHLMIEQPTHTMVVL
jgi:hypothetical protein